MAKCIHTAAYVGLTPTVVYINLIEYTQGSSKNSREEASSRILNLEAKVKCQTNLQQDDHGSVICQNTASWPDPMPWRSFLGLPACKVFAAQCMTLWGCCLPSWGGSSFLRCLPCCASWEVYTRSRRLCAEAKYRITVVYTVRNAHNISIAIKLTPSSPLMHHIVTAMNGFHYRGPLRVIIVINAERIILGNLFLGCQLQKYITQLCKYIYPLLRSI